MNLSLIKCHKPVPKGIMSITLAPFTRLGKVHDSGLEHEVMRILDKWRRLIERERGVSKYSEIYYLTLVEVVKNFNGDYDTLEAYVKKTALSVSVNHFGNNKTSSLDITVDAEGEVPLHHLLTEESLVGSSLNPLNAGYHNDSLQVKQEQLLWAEFLDELMTKDNSKLSLESEDVLLLIQMSVMLDQVVARGVEEASHLRDRYLTFKDYKRWMTTLKIGLANRFSFDNATLEKYMFTWISLYLQNQEVLKRQFALLSSSETVIFRDRKRSHTAVSARVSDGHIRIRAEKHYYVYKIAISDIIDKIYDELFSDSYTNYRFDLNGKTYYNCLNGIFISDGNLHRYIVESLCEVLLQKTKARYIAMTENYLYVELREQVPDFMVYWYYFGVNFPILTEFVGKECIIDGEII